MSAVCSVFGNPQIQSDIIRLMLRPAFGQFLFLLYCQVARYYITSCGYNMNIYIICFNERKVNKSKGQREALCHLWDGGDAFADSGHVTTMCGNIVIAPGQQISVPCYYICCCGNGEQSWSITNICTAVITDLFCYMWKVLAEGRIHDMGSETKKNQASKTNICVIKQKKLAASTELQDVCVYVSYFIGNGCLCLAWLNHSLSLPLCVSPHHNTHQTPQLLHTLYWNDSSFWTRTKCDHLPRWRARWACAGACKSCWPLPSSNAFQTLCVLPPTNWKCKGNSRFRQASQIWEW